MGEDMQVLVAARTWMEATSSSHSPAVNDNDGSSNRAFSSSSSSFSSFLLDDVKIVDKSRHSMPMNLHVETLRQKPTPVSSKARRFRLELLANARDYAIHAKHAGIQPADSHL